MSERQYVFTVEIAGVPVRISCENEENREFFVDYYSDKKPEIFLEPGEEDKARMRRALDRSKARRKEYSDAYLENAAIHSLLADALAARGVLLMHGSAVCMDGEVYLFTAPSGTGKSTHTRLWRQVFGDRAWMVNDDKPMLRVTKDRVWVCGTPWGGKHNLSRNAQAPLKAIILLERGERNHIEKLRADEAYSALFRQFFRSSDAALMAAIMGMEREILRLSEQYRLCCNMEPEAAIVAWRGMNKANKTNDANEANKTDE